jgi:hypothetical protein
VWHRHSCLCGTDKSVCATHRLLQLPHQKRETLRRIVDRLSGLNMGGPGSISWAPLTTTMTGTRTSRCAIAPGILLCGLLNGGTIKSGAIVGSLGPDYFPIVK